MNELEELLYREVLADQKEVVALRRWFHAHPELSTKEYGTQKKIEEELRSYGLEPHETAGTGVWTVIRGEKGEGKTEGISEGKLAENAGEKTEGRSISGKEGGGKPSSSSDKPGTEEPVKQKEEE